MASDMADSVVLKLQKQIEFYFSDANLRHDTFLSTQMKKSSDNYVDLEVIARCNAVKSLTKDRDVIRAAIHLCADLELSDDGQKVRRISSLPEVVNLDDQTIFVDNIPQHADHATVKKVFNKFGTVEYISIPRYPGSGNNKGFAFVEFDSHQAAERAVKAFQDNSGLDQQVDMGSCSESLDKGVSRKKRRKRNRPSSVDSAGEPDSLTPPKKRAIPDSEVANSVAADNCNEKTVEMRMETEGESKTEMQESVKAKDFIDVQKLRVMPKKEWNTMKQIYKKLQREQMSQLKEHLKESGQGQCQQTSTVNNIVPGSIIRIDGKLDGYKPTALRGLFASCGSVEYVDILPDATKGYVRFTSCHGASQVMSRWQDKTLPFSLQDMNLSLLEGEEETSYIERARRQRQESLSVRSKKKRGRDKQCLSKAEALVSSHKESSRIHIRFDDSNDEEDKAVTVETTRSCTEDESAVSISKNKQKRGRKRRRALSKQSVVR